MFPRVGCHGSNSENYFYRPTARIRAKSCKESSDVSFFSYRKHWISRPEIENDKIIDLLSALTTQHSMAKGSGAQQNIDASKKRSRSKEQSQSESQSYPHDQEMPYPQAR
jgi:hypothetical protein